MLISVLLLISSAMSLSEAFQLQGNQISSSSSISDANPENGEGTAYVLEGTFFSGGMTVILFILMFVVVGVLICAGLFGCLFSVAHG